MSFIKGFNSISSKVLVEDAVIKTADWVRNPSWLPLPTLSPQDERFVGLHKVYPTGYNFLSLACAGDYVVDWGDGAVENYTANTQAYHRYSYVPTIDAANSTVSFSTNTVTKYNHGLTDGLMVRFTNVSGNYYLDPSVNYYVISANRHTFQLATVYNGTAITIAKAGTSTATYRTIVNAQSVSVSLNTITKIGHGLTNGTEIRFSNVQASTWLDTNTNYYVISATPDTFQISTEYNGATFTILKDGTSNITLTANLTDITVTLSKDTVTKANHGLVNGTIINFTGGTAYYNATLNTDYYVINSTVNTFQVSETLNGSVFTLLKDGSSTATFRVSLGSNLVVSTPNTITKASHGLISGNVIQFSTSAAYLNLAIDTDYYVVNPTANTFQVSASLDGAAVNIIKDGTSTATFRASITDLMVSANYNTVTKANHGLTNGVSVNFTGSAPWVINKYGTYVVRNATTNTFQVAEGLETSILPIVDSASGTVNNINIFLPVAVTVTTVFPVALNLDTVTRVNHGYANGTQVTFASIVGTTLINSTTTYEVKSATTDTFKLSTVGSSTLLPIMPTAVDVRILTTAPVALNLDTVTKVNHGYPNGTIITFANIVGNALISTSSKYVIANATTDSFNIIPYGFSTISSIMPTSGTATVGFVPVSTGAITVGLSFNTVVKANHGYVNGTKVKFYNISVTNALIASNLDYYITSATTNTFKISTSAGGVGLDIMPPTGTAIVNTLSPTTTNIEVSLGFNTITKANHGLVNGTIITFDSISGVPVITPITEYYVVESSTNTFKISASSGGLAIPIMSTVGSANVTSIDVLEDTDSPVTITSSVVHRANHGYSNGMKVSFYNILNSVELITDLDYYVINATTDTFQVALLANNSAIAITDGTAKLLPFKQAIVSITPKVGHSLSLVNLHKRYDANVPNFQYVPYANAAYVSGFVDIALAGNNITSLLLGVTAAGSSSTQIYLHDLERFNLLSSDIDNISYLFYNCKGLQKIENFSITCNTGVITSTNVFRGCATLKTVPLFDTSKFSSFNSFFYDCYNLVSIPKFNTASATDFTSMFQNCLSIVSIPTFDGDAVTTTSMFQGCISLSKAPLISLRYATNISSMFKDCKALEVIPLYNLNTATTVNASYMFNGCSSLVTIPQLNTIKVNTFTGMFSDCVSLKSIPKLDTSSGTNFFLMFNGCKRLGSIPTLNTSIATNLSSMFIGCATLKSMPLLDTGNNIDFSYMFSNCSSLKTIPKLNTSKGINFSYMFEYCSSLETIADIDTAKATDFSYMFLECSNLISIPLLQTPVVTNFRGIFKGCLRLKKVPALYMGAVTNPENLVDMVVVSPNLRIYDFVGMVEDFSIMSLNLSVKDIETVFYNLGTGHGRASQIIYVDNGTRHLGSWTNSDGLVGEWDTRSVGFKLYHANIGATNPTYLDTPSGGKNISYGYGEGPIIYGVGCGLTTPLGITITRETMLFTCVNHGLVNGQVVQFSIVTPATGGYTKDINNCNLNIKALEKEYDAQGKKYFTEYIVMNVTPDTFQVGGILEKGDTTNTNLVHTTTGIVDTTDTPPSQFIGEGKKTDPIPFKSFGTVTIYRGITATISKVPSFFKGNVITNVVSKDPSTGKYTFIVTTNKHPFVQNDILSFGYLGATPITDSVKAFTIYYVNVIDEYSFMVSLTPNGANIPLQLKTGVTDRNINYNYVTRVKYVQGTPIVTRNPYTNAIISTEYPYIELDHPVGSYDEGYTSSVHRYHFVTLNIAIALLKGWGVYLGYEQLYFPYYVAGSVSEPPYIGS